MGSTKNSVLVTLFFIIILSPLTMDLFFKDPENAERSQESKREVLDSLNFSLSSLSGFPEKFEKYYNENFGLRKPLIKAFYFFKVFFLREDFPSKQIVIGKNGWVYYLGNNDGLGVNDYQGKLKLTEHELQKIKINIEQQKKWLEKRGIEYIIVICPNKQTVYPEYFPDIPKDKNTILEQTVQYLKSNSNVEILDLRDALRNAKDKFKYPLYFKTDSHWNHLGAYIGYREIMNKLSQNNKELRPLNLKRFHVYEEKSIGRDAPEIVGLQDYFEDSVIKMDLINPSDTLQSKKLSSVVIFHDSYYRYMKGFLNFHFKKVGLKHHFWNSFDYGFIESEKPDLVIYQMVERYQGSLLRDNPKEIIE